MGSVQNFWKQHNPGVSKACKLNLEKKNKAAAHPQKQPGLLYFFTKQPKNLIPPTVPTPTPMIAYTMEPGSSGPVSRSALIDVSTTASKTASESPVPDTHAGSLLMMLEKAISNLPVLPEASESDEIVVFSQSMPVDLAKDDAWKYLDPTLNCFLGFNRTTESISEALRGGEKGLVAMARYLREFVCRYQIDEGLLEGKIQRLLDAIKMWCVSMKC